MPPSTAGSRWRLAAATVAGALLTVASAVVLGDYPLTGAVPWVTPVLIPLLIGVTMTVVAGGFHRRVLWAATGLLAAGAILWGVRIATGWGLDPVPGSWWAVVALALVWPPLWGLASARRQRPSRSGLRQGPAAGGPAVGGAAAGEAAGSAASS